jgi:hypothetical protein
MTAGSPKQTHSPWLEFAIAALQRTVGELVGCGTKRPFAHAAIADAASLRGCSTFAAALQPKSPEQSFKALLSHKIQTVLPSQAVPTIQSRTSQATLLQPAYAESPPNCSVLIAAMRLLGSFAENDLVDAKTNLCRDFDGSSISCLQSTGQATGFQ